MRYGKHDYKYRLTQLGTEKIKNDSFYRRGSLKGHKSYTEILCYILFDCPDIGFKEIENKFIASGVSLKKYKDLSRSLELILLSCIKRKEVERIFIKSSAKAGLLFYINKKSGGENPAALS